MIIVSYLSHLIIMILKMVMVDMVDMVDTYPSVILGGGGAVPQKVTPTWRRSLN